MPASDLFLTEVVSVLWNEAVNVCTYEIVFAWFTVVFYYVNPVALCRFIQFECLGFYTSFLWYCIAILAIFDDIEQFRLYLFQL